MSDDPAERLRRSNEITIPAVLEIGHSNEVEAMTAGMGDVVRLPVRLEWSDASPRTRGVGPWGDVAAADVAREGGAGGTPRPSALAEQSGRAEQVRDGSGAAIAPIPSVPRRHRARFISES